MGEDPPCSKINGPRHGRRWRTRIFMPFTAASPLSSAIGKAGVGGRVSHCGSARAVPAEGIRAGKRTRFRARMSPVSNSRMRVVHKSCRRSCRLSAAVARHRSGMGKAKRAALDPATGDDDALVALLAAGLRLSASDNLWRVSGNNAASSRADARSGRQLEQARPVLGVHGRGSDRRSSPRPSEAAPAVTGHNSGEATKETPH
jgi:hypothetical protein